jgi:hypothetical protein
MPSTYIRPRPIVIAPPLAAILNASGVCAGYTATPMVSSVPA